MPPLRAFSGRWDVIDLDTLSRLVIVLAPLIAILLLVTLGWVARQIRDSCSAVLLRSWWRGHRRRARRRKLTPAGPERAPADSQRGLATPRAGRDASR